MAKPKREAAAVRISHPKLRYVTDDRPGIQRRRAGSGFSFVRPNGRTLSVPKELARIRSLAIPPAWKNVWISPDPWGHLQATGQDDRGRKQYRYHPEWRAVRDETKYGRLLSFGRALPRIRRRVARDLKRAGLPRPKVIAAVVRLLEQSLVRVGNEAHADRYKHYGLTTLQDRHIRVRGSQIHFRFLGKSGKEHEFSLANPELARIVKHCQELPGQDLFQYVDADGKRRDVESALVNDYIREAAGEEFTAKDFRTWAGTVLAARELYALGPPASKAAATRGIGHGIRAVSNELRNTPAVCRKSYVHPGVLRAYADGSLWTAFGDGRTRGAPLPRLGLREAESQMMRFLRRRA